MLDPSRLGHANPIRRRGCFFPMAPRPRRHLGDGHRIDEAFRPIAAGRRELDRGLRKLAPERTDRHDERVAVRPDRRACAAASNSPVAKARSSAKGSASGCSSVTWISASHPWNARTSTAYGIPQVSRAHGPIATAAKSGSRAPASFTASPQSAIFSGEKGIRTLGTLASTHDFQSCTFGHSVISPNRHATTGAS